MPKLTGGEMVIDYLIKEGVTHMFGVAGHGVLGLLDAAHERQDKIQTVMVRHEEVAGFMADGFYRLAHKPAATFTSSGPGSVNVIIALAEAMSDSVPFLAITGDVAACQFNTGALQETYRYREADFPSVLRHYVKRTFQVTRVENMPKVLVHAFKIMLSGRSGPVNIDVPYDVFGEEAEVELLEPAAWSRPINSQMPGNPAAVEKAVELLLSAEKPAILAGHGVFLAEAWDELRRVATEMNIPVFTSALAKGVLPEDETLCLGAAGVFGTYPANETARKADVILALGCRFSDLHASSWKPGYTYNIPPTKLIHVDIDPEEIGRNYPVEIGIMGDVKMVLQQVLEALKGQATRKYEAWWEQIAQMREKWERFMEPRRTSDKVPIQFERAFAEARKAFPRNTVVSTDAGNAGGWAVQQWLALEPYNYISAGGFNAMGWAASAIMGAKLAAPERTCVCICGDGSFIMVPHVVATAVEYNIPVIWLVLNDYSWGAIKGLQGAYLGGREHATSFRIQETGELYNPDFAAWARSCGAEGEQIKDPATLAPAMERAVKSGKPYVLDVIMDREEGLPLTSNWEMPPYPIGAPIFTGK